MNFYNKYSPREQWEKFGVCSVHFFPFENQDLDNFEDVHGLDEAEYQQKLKEYLISTVHEGMRFYFKDYKKLQEFCEMIEGSND